ncbi:hypothetical protein BJX68DRAFT_266712 [Aspergillus pseudodeflectus]|uniref:Uncharacterized protein n=1 Tax=Aspergillus pseudodeflectus TaxID=176178 RepID=A0ABR4KDY5_9EURO
MILTSLSFVGLRFNTAPWHTQIHPTLKSLLEAFRRLIRHLRIGTLFPEVTTPTDNNLFVIIQHQLLSTHYSHTASNEIEKGRRRHHPNVNEPLRLSLIIYLYTRVSDFQNLPIMRCMLQTFKQSLEVALPGMPLSSFHASAPDLLFWLLFIGGMASQEHSPHSWLVSHLEDVARILTLEDWMTEVRPLLGEFSTRIGRRIRGRRTCGVM